MESTEKRLQFDRCVLLKIEFTTEHTENREIKVSFE